MRKLLLSSLLCLGFIGAKAEYIPIPDNAQEFQNYEDGYYFSFSVLDEENKTAALSFVSRNSSNSVVTSITLPATATRTIEVLNEETGDYDNVDITYTVIETRHEYPASDFPDLKSLTIPGSYQVIGVRSLEALYGYVTEITFEPGETPLEIYPQTSYRPSNDKTSAATINLNRTIKVVPEYKSSTQTATLGEWSILPTLENPTTVNIGDKIGAIEGDFFSSLKNVTAVNFTNWGKWYNDVVVDNIGAIPYAGGKAKLSAGGNVFTTVEIPADATAIPDYKNAGLKFEGDIDLPESITYIGKYAFYNQSNLFNVIMPDGVTVIADHAFDGCDALVLDYFPTDLVSIGDYAFRGCGLIKTITLPEGVETLGKGAFSKMATLEKATLLSKVTEIPDELFAGCDALYTVYLPTEATSIGDFAFMNTPAMQELLLPKTLETIGTGAFIYVPFYSDVQQLMKENVFSQENVIEYLTRQGVYGPVNKMTFPETLKSIGDYAFVNQDLLILNLPEGLETIGIAAFANNYHLNTLTLPSTLTSIADYAFGVYPTFLTGNYGMNLSVLGSVVIPDAVTNLGAHAFERWVGDFTIGKGVKELSELAVGYPSILTIGENVSTINNNAIGFKYTYNDKTVHNLKTLTLLPAKRVPTVSSNFNLATADYDYITMIVPDGTGDTYARNPRWKEFNMVEEAETDIFVYIEEADAIAENIRLQSGLMPSRVVKLKVNGTISEANWRIIRENMISLIELDLSDVTNTELPEDALKNMSILTKVIMPKKLTKIGANAFYGCTLLDTPEIPVGVTEIGDYAFYNCTKLSITELPEALTTLGKDVFRGCASLRTLTAGENLAELADYDEWTVNNEDSYNAPGLFSNCIGLEYVDLSASKLTNIPYQSFYNCSALATAIFPETLETIGNFAFKNSGLESVSFPESVASIGQDAFFGTKLRAVVVPDAVKDVQDYTFAECSRLVSASFPQGLAHVGKFLFSMSERVTGISCANPEPPVAETDAFTDMRVKNCSLTVPQQSFKAYLNANQWGKFSSIQNRLVVTIPEDVIVSVIDEEEYQEILEEEEMSTLYVEAETVEDEPVEVRARKAAKASLAKGESFTRLFNDAMFGTPQTPRGTRFFINPGEGVEITKVELNDMDITDKLVDGALLINEKLDGSFRIFTKTSGISEIEFEGEEAAICKAYDTTGRLVYEGATAAFRSTVAPGIYILKSGSKTEKVLVK